MNKEKIIGLLIKEALFPVSKEESVTQKKDVVLDLPEEDWKELYQELSAQAIEGTPCEWALKNLEIPEIVKSHWQKSRMNQVVYFYRLLQGQSELCHLMKEHGIPMAILKGTAAAMYYPDPTARAMGDIDFLVSEADFQSAYHLMKDHGYQLMYEEDHVDYHITLGKDGFIFEIHRQPAGMLDGPEGDYLMELIQDGLQKAEEVDVDSYRIPVLPGLQNGLVLLLHIVKHLKSGLGLRQIIDWMMYVNQELHDENWYGSMQPVLRKVELETLAKSVTKMCQLYLGLGEAEITWCSDISDEVCGELMGYIMQQGNFGRKVMSDDKGVKIVGEIHNPVQFFRLLQERGQKQWELVKKQPALKHVAWFYMLCRYIRKSLQRKAPMKTLLSDVKAGNDRRNLFDQLGIYRK